VSGGGACAGIWAEAALPTIVSAAIHRTKIMSSQEDVN
jgi:hypothetical protein